MACLSMVLLSHICGVTLTVRGVTNNIKDLVLSHYTIRFDIYLLLLLRIINFEENAFCIMHKFIFKTIFNGVEGMFVHGVTEYCLWCYF